MPLRIAALTVSLLATLALAGCAESDSTTDGEQAVLDEIPTPEEADAEAAALITEENADEELAKLESELAAELAEDGE